MYNASGRPDGPWLQALVPSCFPTPSCAPCHHLVIIELATFTTAAAVLVKFFYITIFIVRICVTVVP